MDGREPIRNSEGYYKDTESLRTELHACAKFGVFREFMKNFESLFDIGKMGELVARRLDDVGERC